MKECVAEATESFVETARAIERAVGRNDRHGARVARGAIDAADVLLHFERLVDAGDDGGMTSYFEAAEALARQADALARGLDRLVLQLAVRRERIVAVAGRMPSNN